MGKFTRMDLSKSNKAVLLAYERGYRVLINGVMVNAENKEMNPCVNNKGYKTFTIRIPHSRQCKSFLVHRLMAYQKFGDSVFEKGIEVRHLNGSRIDNSFNNIEIGTRSQNAMDVPKTTRDKIALLGS